LQAEKATTVHLPVDTGVTFSMIPHEAVKELRGRVWEWMRVQPSL